MARSACVGSARAQHFCSTCVASLLAPAPCRRAPCEQGLAGAHHLRVRTAPSGCARPKRCLTDSTRMPSLLLRNRCRFRRRSLSSCSWWCGWLTRHANPPPPPAIQLPPPTDNDELMDNNRNTPSVWNDPPTNGQYMAGSHAFFSCGVHAAARTLSGGNREAARHKTQDVTLVCLRVVRFLRLLVVGFTDRLGVPKGPHCLSALQTCLN